MSAEYISKEKNFISIVIHFKNEEDHIQKFLLSIDGLLKEKFEAYEIIIVNNNSDSSALQSVKGIVPDINGNVILVDLAWDHDLETAMLAGINVAIGDFVMEFDSPKIDYDNHEVWSIYQKCLEGYDIVAASSNHPVKFSSKLFYNYLNKVSYRKMELTTESFRIISRRALNRVLQSTQKLRYRKALYHYSGFDTHISYYKPINAERPEQDISIREKMKFAMDILVGYSNIGTRIASGLSFFFFILSLLAVAYTIYSYLTYEGIQLGWTTTMLFLSGSFTGIFLILALLSRYLVVILREVQNSPDFIYKSVDRLSNK